MLEIADEIVATSAGHDGQLRIFKAHESAQDVVYRAVAADRVEPGLLSRAGSLPDVLGGLVLAERPVDLKVELLALGEAPYAGEQLGFGCPAARGRIDYEYVLH